MNVLLKINNNNNDNDNILFKINKVFVLTF